MSGLTSGCSRRLSCSSWRPLRAADGRRSRSRLDGGLGTVSSSSRSCRRSRSSPGDRRVLPAPAGVPVDRFVGIGLVGPRTERPVSGVCARSFSMPVPPRRREPRADPARALARAPAARNCFIDRFADDGRFAEDAAFFFFPRGVFAPAVLRPVFRRAVDARPLPAPLRADARAPAAVRLFDGVRFCPFVERLPEELAALRRDAFLAMSSTPVCWTGVRRPTSVRRAH